MRLSDREKLRRATTTPTTAQPLVEFHEVSVAHAHTRLLDHLDLTVHTGEHVALVGLSTTATTALTHLLTGHTHPTHGHITTHTPVHTTTPDPHHTLAQAITHHTGPEHDDPHLSQALNHTGLHHIDPHTQVSDLPPALHPTLHQARTLYALATGARLIVTTEHTTPPPTPHTGLLHLTDHPTRVREADRILVVDNTRVTETGTHRQLLALGGAYARLYALHGPHRTR